MAKISVFLEKIMRVIRAYGAQMRRLNHEKDKFYGEMTCEWDLQSFGKIVFGLQNLMDML